MEEEGFVDADSGRGIYKVVHLVIVRVFEHDFVEELGSAVAAAATVGRVCVVVEGVIGGLAEVAAPENELAEVKVEWVEEGLPVGASEQLRPCYFWFGCFSWFHGDGDGDGVVKERKMNETMGRGVGKWQWRNGIWTFEDETRDGVLIILPMAFLFFSLIKLIVGPLEHTQI